VSASVVTPFAWMLDLLDAVGSGQHGSCRTRGQCPGHVDRDPSLSVGEGRMGQALLHCFAECELAEVLAALNVPDRYLWTPPPVSAAEYVREFTPPITFPPVSQNPRNPRNRLAGFRVAGFHRYTETVRLVRFRSGDDKAVEWESLRGGCWLPGLFGAPISSLPLYRENEIRMAVAAGEPVLLVESESSVDALVGWYATTWAGGAGSPQIGQLTAVLGGYSNLVVVPDNDTAGLDCLDRLRAHGLAPHVLMPAPGEDPRDLLARLGPPQFAEQVTAALNATTTELRVAS
jgi:hypothetical protein